MIGLGERMKGYEGVPDILLTRRLPILLRVDGRAFHTYTKAFDKPFDPRIHEAMEKATADLLHEISGAVFGYFQSDEISVLIRTDMTLETEPWFGGRVQKIVSVAAAIASVSFSLTMLQQFQVDRPALGQAHFSHKELMGKKIEEVRGMLDDKGVFWEEMSTRIQRGQGMLRSGPTQHPSFSLDPSFIQGLLAQPPTEDKTPGPK